MIARKTVSPKRSFDSPSTFGTRLQRCAALLLVLLAMGATAGAPRTVHAATSVIIQIETDDGGPVPSDVDACLAPINGDRPTCRPSTTDSGYSSVFIDFVEEGDYSLVVRKSAPYEAPPIIVSISGFEVKITYTLQSPVTDPPTPEPSIVPEPTATDVPEPTSTNIPEPTVTEAPEPTSTDVPEPTATSTPNPTAIPPQMEVLSIGPECTSGRRITGMIELANADGVSVITFALDVQPLDGDGSAWQEISTGDVIATKARVTVDIAKSVEQQGVFASAQPASMGSMSLMVSRLCPLHA